MTHQSITALGLCSVLLLGACTDSGGQGQTINVSDFGAFTFTRSIALDACFDDGDLVSAEMTSQAGNRVLNFTMLKPAENETDDCATMASDGQCLTVSDVTTRVLVDAENTRVDQLFSRIQIANSPDPLCGSGNIKLCSEDEYNWDGLTVSNDFCHSVYVVNAYEIMDLMQDFRDGPPDETASGGGLQDSAFESKPVEIIEVTPIIASDQLLGKNGDYAVLRNQSALDGALLQDGTASIDFSQHIGVAVVILRPPCQQYTGIDATETLLTVDVKGTLEADDDCSFDLGSIDAFLIVIPKTPKKVRLFLSGSELDEVRL